MDLDPGILCFFHCSRRVFCFDVPTRCPLCQIDLSNNIFPFRVPYPFVRPAQHPCSIVIKSTDGTFLRDYEDQDDLHIAVTSSTGTLFEYDHRGLTIGMPTPSWDQSLLVFNETQQERFPSWDDNLSDLSRQPQWTSSRYCEANFNCYDFVLVFLQNMNRVRGDLPTTRTGFMEKFVYPTISKALKYIKLYRQVSQNGVYVGKEHCEGN